MNPELPLRTGRWTMAAATLLFVLLISGCAKSTPATQAALYISRGQSRMAKQEYDRAIIEFRNAARLLPASAEPTYQIALAYLSSGDYRSGITFLLRTVQLDPRHAGAQLKLEELRAGEEPGDLGSNLVEIAERRLQAILDASSEASGESSSSTHTPLPDLEKAFDRDPQNPEIQSHLIRAYLNARRFGTAEQMVDRILQQNETRRTRTSVIAGLRQFVANIFNTPSDATDKGAYSTADEAAELQAEQKRQDEHRQNALDDEKQQKREDARILVLRGQLYLATVRAKEAEQDLVQVLSLESHDALAHYLLSKVHEVHGADFARRQELTETVELDAEWLQARLELARSRTDGGAAEAAVDLLDQAPQGQKNDLALNAARNWALLALDNREAVQKGLDRGMAIKKTPEFLLQDGYLRLRKNDTVGARKSLELALQTLPPDLRAVDGLAETYWREKNAALALETMQTYVSRYPKSAGLQYLLGTWLVRLNRRDDAKAAFQDALNARPGFLAALERLADIDIAEGHLSAARETATSMAAAPGGGSEAELALGVMEERPGGNPQSAITHYRKVLEDSPDNITALNNLAYHLTGDPHHADEALKLALRLKKLAPNRAAVDDTLGWAYYNTGAYELATIYLQKALSKQSKPGRGYRLAMAYFKAGTQDRARATLRDAMKLDPTAPEAAAAQRLINGTEAPKK